MKTNLLQEKLSLRFHAGWGMLLISFLIYLMLPSQLQETGDPFTGAFMLNYIFSLVYGVILLFDFFFRKSKPVSRVEWMFCVLLFTVSAFALNRSMLVFARFPAWLDVYTLVSAFTLLLLPFDGFLPRWVRVVLYFLSGAGILHAFYFSIVLIPLMPIGLVGAIFFGVSLHAFVPFGWLWHYARKLLEDGAKRIFIVPFILGLLLPLTFLVYYLNRWNVIQADIRDAMAHYHLIGNDELPFYVDLAQSLPSSPLVEEILLSPYQGQRAIGWSTLSGGNNDRKFHDPLATLASGLFGELNLDGSELEKLVQIRADYRHETNTRYWTGQNLRTDAMTTEIELMPEYRLAYVQKTLSIYNDGKNRSREVWFPRNTQEAVYSFYLPEGSIVTSLSLWVDGKERKSRLSTRQKATDAYRQIVGVQQRDPALVHWQEGNRVSVNVFPCTTSEKRQFRIGFTTPLIHDGDKVTFSNPWFRGPDLRDCREAIRIRAEGEELTGLPEGFRKEGDRFYTYEGDALKNWSFSAPVRKLSGNGFYFNGTRVGVREAKSEVRQTPVTDLYLDVMRDWEKEEYDRILDMQDERRVYIFDPMPMQVTNANREEVWDKLKNRPFSLPLLYEIYDPEHALILTKSGQQSPLLEDLKDSRFADRTREWFKKGAPDIRVINFGDGMSAFLRSLRELGLIHYDKMELEEALNAVQSGQFRYWEESETRVVLPESHLTLVREPSETWNGPKAPDHLLRLFAYNHIMKELGSDYFFAESYEDSFFREAEEAYVLTPMTSLVVLETDSDYERQGIGENHNTLGNAGILGGGAVPEPHEWVLIILVAAFIAWKLGLPHYVKQLFHA